MCGLGSVIVTMPDRFVLVQMSYRCTLELMAGHQLGDWHGAFVLNSFNGSPSDDPVILVTLTIILGLRIGARPLAHPNTSSLQMGVFACQPS